MRYIIEKRSEIMTEEDEEKSKPEKVRVIAKSTMKEIEIEESFYNATEKIFQLLKRYGENEVTISQIGFKDHKTMRRLIEYIGRNTGINVKLYRDVFGITGRDITLEEWETNRNRQRKETLVITSKNKDNLLSYAETIKNLRKQIDIQDIGVKVIEVRKVQGGFALKTAESKEGAADKLEFEIRRAIGEENEIRRSQRKKTIVVRDIEETIEKEEFREAVEKIIGQGSIVSIDMLEQKTEAEMEITDAKGKEKETTQGEDHSRKGDRGRIKFKTAMLTLLEDRGLELLKRKRITVGWGRCRIHEKINPPRCYKCQQFGHASYECKNEEYVKQKCLKCGSEEHMARECQNEVKCYVFGKEGHRADSMKCEKYREMVERLRYENGSSLVNRPRR